MTNKTKQLVADLLQSTTPQDQEAEHAPEAEENAQDPQSIRLQGLLPFPENLEANADNDSDALETIELYFEADDPIQRDILIEQLAANPSQHATDFFLSAASQDPDSYIQSQAAEALCRRGNPHGTEFLYSILADPEDITLLNHSIQVLSAVQGDSFFDVLLSIWQDPERSGEEKREAIIGLENLDAERTLDACMQFFNGIKGAADIPDDIFALILAILVRHDATDFIPKLKTLHGLLKRDPGVSPEDIELLLEELESAIELLSNDEPA